MKVQLYILLLLTSSSFAGWQREFVSFDPLAVTATNQLPSSSSDWLYTTTNINPDLTYPMTTYDWAGWRNTNGYAFPNGSVHSLFYLYLDQYNSDHMGFETYGYFEITHSNAVKGNALRYVVTGGKNSTSTNGLKVTTKQQYTNYLHLGQDPVGHGARAGHPFVYFANNSAQGSELPFPEAVGANRLSIYVYPPASLTNGPGGYGKRPVPTINLGPFNGVGGHWYHEICTQGGGWMHILADGHPQHNNSWYDPSYYPYPSSSLRDMGTNYYTNMYRWYITFKPYSGIATIPYSVYYDEIEFRYDDEPQNNETIATPAVVYFPSNKTFEIGFMDKYKNFAYSYSTYEVRYSFSQIYNTNWDQATPVHILADPRFHITNRTDGVFQKYWPYYASVWAPFELANSNDTAQLTPGTMVYFAVKDISQVGGNSQSPVTNSTVGYWPTGGRDYTTYAANFDYAGDQPALLLIKRIDYRIPIDLEDTDADGLPNWWEQAHFGNPTNTNPVSDNDNDGDNDLKEYYCDTDPNDSNSVLKIMQVQSQTSAVSMCWQGGVHARQWIEYRKDLCSTTEQWSTIYTNAPPTALTNVIPIAQGASQGVYRVKAHRVY